MVATAAIATNQIMFMRGTMRASRGSNAENEGDDNAVNNLLVPVRRALWASVSDVVSEKLEKQNADGAPYRLAPHEWKRGDNLWLLAMVGPEKVLPELKKKLAETAFDEDKFREYLFVATRNPEVPEGPTRQEEY